MSRMATNEYIGAKHRLYATADREKRIKMLDEGQKGQSLLIQLY